MTEESLWTLDEIREAGFDYDSSVCPVKNFAYGVPDAPECPHLLHNGLLEIPLTQTKLFGYRFMVGGGFYLRVYPFWLTRLLLRRRDRSLPRVFYFHTWEYEDRRLNLWDLGVDLPVEDHLREGQPQRQVVAREDLEGVLLELRQQPLGVEDVPLRLLFEHPSVAELAEALREVELTETASESISRQPRTPYRPGAAGEPTTEKETATA